MALRLYNTLSGKIEDFHPLDDNRVRMYACGPTVYDYGHIGNFRTFIAVDLLYRFLRQSGYVVHVGDVHDVADVISALAQKAIKKIDGDEGSEIANVAVVIDGWPAGIHADAVAVKGMKFFDLAGKSVIEMQCHG